MHNKVDRLSLIWKIKFYIFTQLLYKILLLILIFSGLHINNLFFKILIGMRSTDSFCKMFNVFRLLQDIMAI